jgi:hypothetical protein
MGRIRFFSLKNNVNISFKLLDFSKFIDSYNLQINIDNLITQINSQKGVGISKEMINSALQMQLPGRLVDCKYISSGHDVIEILGISLRKLWGTNNSNDVRREKLEKHFRIGYSNQEFIETEMFKRLSKLLSKGI